MAERVRHLKRERASPGRPAPISPWRLRRRRNKVLSMKNLLRFSPHRKPIHPRVRKSINEDTRDRPLYLGWRPKDPEAFTLLKLPKPRNKTTQLAQTQIIGAALVTGREDPERWVSYSRAKTFYEGVKARYGETYTYQLVVPGIDILA